MKKVIRLLCVALIAYTPFTVYAQGNDIEQVVEETLLKEEIQIDDTAAGESSESGLMKELTLEDIIQLGIENNINLNLQLESFQEMESDQLLIQLQTENVKERFKLMLTSAYLDLLLLQEQIEHREKLLASDVNEVNKYQILFGYGKVSQEKLNEVEISIENEKEQLREIERGYRYKFSDLCSDIGISYNSDLSIKSIDFEVKELEKPTGFSFLIEDSYAVRGAKKKLENEMFLDSEQRFMAEQNYIVTKNEIQRKIEQLYREAEKSYSAYQESVHQLEIEKKELENLQIRYDLGKIAKHDYEKAQFELDAAELKVYQLELQNYKNQQSIQALHKGYI